MLSLTLVSEKCLLASEKSIREGERTTASAERKSVRVRQIPCSLSFSRYVLDQIENRRSVNMGFCNDVKIFPALT